MKRVKSVIALLVALLLLGGLGYTSYYGLGSDKSGSLKSINLGLDLAGGVSITYEVVGDGTPSAEDMSDTIYKLQQRVDQYSTESQVYQEGSNRINIEIPGVTDANKILEDLGQPGNLYFIAQTDSQGNENYTYNSGFTVDEDGNYVLSGDGEIGYVLNKTIEELEAEGSIVLKGEDVAQAEAGYQNSGTANTQEVVVSLEFTEAGRQAFAEATKKAYANGESIGIYYDGEFISVPTVQAEITDGRAIITGEKTFEDAANLASMIRIGGLKLQLNELRSNVVGAQLGSNAIHTSMIAAIVGFCAIILFMIVLYKLLGVAASIALMFYCGLEILLLSAFEITLTLPGIAGIILSVGMAVDANVLVFARIREEIAGGKDVKGAIKVGYSKALSAILDGNITTLIAAAILGLRGTGTVKGFASTLALGIVVSMFTALFVTRAITNIFYGLGFEDKKWYGQAKELKLFDFTTKRKMFYGISAAIIILGFVFMGVNAGRGQGAFNYSLDFVGGTSTSVTFNEAWTTEKLDSEVVPKIKELTGVDSVQVQTVAGSNQVIFKTVTLTVDQREAVDNMFKTDYSVPAENIAAESISSTISNEMRTDATVALIIALVLMLAYIWIRFRDIKFGAAAIIALAHDALIVITCYALTRIQVGGTFIAAVLTIIGYSINDTIVTFDRIRENHIFMNRQDQLEELVNKSVSQTITRSLFTSITTFIMVLSLAIFGVPDIRFFALPLMVGVVAGTYSSIFIASPIWLDLKKFKKN
ncbi:MULTISPECIES: protein translocase subunit SecD [unclassified Butyrivibrio]|uniref:protein translocase subunit SecD n=1 Tax=unclassified Butyrivibrio TaxID=2639466 RepID=UPI00041277F0|nr:MULTISPECIES: protein translocase subunit SecD [unclassified Butyrivibrio]SDB24868.1 SecD/SecF fusion protein [Butyrivibrio sp. INlla16]